jgi:3-dehydroquinate synthase
MLINFCQDIEQHFKDREILQSLNGMDKYIAKGIETKLDIVVADEKDSTACPNV